MSTLSETRRLLDITAAVVIGQSSVFLAPAIMQAESGGWGLSDSQVANLESGELATYATSCIICARLIHRVSWRRMFLLGGCIVGVGSLLSACVPSVWELIVARFLVAIGGGFAGALGGAMLGTAERPERDANISFALLSLTFAGILSLLPWAFSMGGASGVFGTVAGVMLSLMFWRGFSIKQGAPKIQVYKAVSSSISLPICFFFLAIAMIWVVMGGVYSLSEQVGMRIGLSGTTVGGILSGVNIVGMLSCGIAGAIGGKPGQVTPLIVSVASMAIASVAAMCTSSPIIYGAGLLVFGATNILVTSYSLGVAALLDDRGRVAAAFMGFIALPYALGPAAFGWLMGHRGTTELGIVIGVLCIAALPILVRLLLSHQKNRARVVAGIA